MIYCTHDRLIHHLSFTPITTLACWQEKFVGELEVIVKRSSSKSITVESQWMSEKEMKDELKWSQHSGRKWFVIEINIPNLGFSAQFLLGMVRFLENNFTL